MHSEVLSGLRTEISGSIFREKERMERKQLRTGREEKSVEIGMRSKAGSGRGERQHCFGKERGFLLLAFGTFTKLLRRGENGGVLGPLLLRCEWGWKLEKEEKRRGTSGTMWGAAEEEGEGLMGERVALGRRQDPTFQMGRGTGRGCCRILVIAEGKGWWEIISFGITADSETLGFSCRHCGTAGAGARPFEGGASAHFPWKGSPSLEIHGSGTREFVLKLLCSPVGASNAASTAQIWPESADLTLSKALGHRSALLLHEITWDGVALHSFTDINKTPCLEHPACQAGPSCSSHRLTLPC